MRTMLALAMVIATSGCGGQAAELAPEGSTMRMECEVPLRDGGMLLVVDLIDADCDALASEMFPDAGTE